MVIDSLKSSAQYEQLNPLFKKAFDYLKSLDITNLEIGKKVLVKDKLVVIISDSTLKAKENAKLEIHNEYIDIQMPISKAEGFGWSHTSSLESPAAPFDKEKDIQFFDDGHDAYFELSPGNFAIFFPHDAHAPCIGEGNIRKIVVKVKVE